MKHFRIVGLCLVAAFAFMAVAAASSASAAQFGICVAHKKGKYSDGSCTTLDEKKGKPKGSFEFEAPNSCFAQKKGKYAEGGCATLDEKKGKPKGSFEFAPKVKITATSGPGELKTPLLGSITCTASTNVGELTGPTTGNIVATFTGCEGKGAPCETNPLGTPGEIVTNNLEVTLVEPTTGTAELLFQAKSPAKYSDEIFCNATGGFVRTGGFNGGDMTPTNTMTKTGTIVFGGSVQQKLATEVECGLNEWSGEPAAKGTCEGVGIPKAALEPPLSGKFPSEELETANLVAAPEFEVKVN